MSETLNGSAVLTVTDEALAIVVDARSDEHDASTLALWLEANVAPNGSYTYDMYFQPRNEAAATDMVVEIRDDLAVVIPAASVARVNGSTLSVANGGMVLMNPNEPKRNAPPAAIAPTGSLEGPVAAQVIQILETQVNPSIASHGGFATLISVDGDTAFITMGGGCQGCAMSKATLSQGIEVAIKQNVPEITRVVDVTDHATGATPYYA